MMAALVLDEWSAILPLADYGRIARPRTSQRVVPFRRNVIRSSLPPYVDKAADRMCEFDAGQGRDTQRFSTRFPLLNSGFFEFSRHSTEQLVECLHNEY